jgi:hypothetical protein
MTKTVLYLADEKGKSYMDYIFIERACNYLKPDPGRA